MRSRASEAMPSPAIVAAARAPSPPRSASRNAAWTSRSGGMGTPQERTAKDALGSAGLFEQYRERRDIGVPLDQGRHRAEAHDRAAVQVPYLGRGRRAVITDENGLPVGIVLRVAGEMHLLDPSRWQRVEVCRRIDAEVLRGDVDVVDVAEQPAARPRR